MLPETLRHVPFDREKNLSFLLASYHYNSAVILIPRDTRKTGRGVRLKARRSP